MVGIHRMAQPKAVGQKTGAEQHRVTMKDENGEAPKTQIDNGQQRQNGHDPLPKPGVQPACHDNRQQTPEQTQAPDICLPCIDPALR
jgi:hypothetical protein